MDIRSMQYFLAVAREGSFTKAADALHMTQPPLSRQIKDLEEELGTPLFDRSGRRVTLTEEGLLFRERAQEAVDLFESIRLEMSAGSETVCGEIRIACGETEAVSLIAASAWRLRADHGSVIFRLLSGDGDFVQESLQRGAADLGLLVTGSVDGEAYDFLELPAKDRWGVLMGEDCALASRPSVTRDDLAAMPLILPYRAARSSDLMAWFGAGKDDLDVVATYDLAYNASRFAREGVGLAVALDGIVDVGPGTGLVFRPLSPALETNLFVVWRKHQRLPRAAQALVSALRTNATPKA
ncbi:MAG: LysR family transcriptional regulator [Eggerthellaceae bacterium]|nr:LysR family transcriptional regulator [Eggerthellaceae bacterium]